MSCHTWWGADFQGGTAARPGDDFWQFNVLAGYRFARNRCEISAGILNLANTNYQFDPNQLPRHPPARTHCRDPM